MKLRDIFLLAGSLAAASQVNALSLGNSQGSVQLGSPLDLTFQIRPDADHTAGSSCVKADVWMGDHALASDRIQLTTQAESVRVRTTPPVYEPLITVKLHAGCAGVVSRSYTFFADPPSTLAASLEPIDLSKIQAPALAAPRPQAAPPLANAEKKARPPQRAVAAKPASRPIPTAPAAATTTAAAFASPAPAPEALVSTEPLEAASDKPRLRIEPLEGLDLLEPSATAGSAASTNDFPSLRIQTNSELASSAHIERLETLEKQLQTLQSQFSSNRTHISDLQSQLAEAKTQDLPFWIYAILALLAAALAGVAWLLQRLKQAQQDTPNAWESTVLAAKEATPPPAAGQEAAPPASPAPDTTVFTTNAALRSAIPEPSSTADAAPLHAAYSSVVEPAVFTPELQTSDLYKEFDQLSGSLAAPPVVPQQSLVEVLTAQALFDVQEQAEFYASIGENDQAIEILQTHIAAHESSSPLAYIELLQLLYRLSRTDAFEQVREQFQKHFNVQVPSFLGFARKGRDLWSGHPDVLSQIEAIWPTDDVAALLHKLIVQQPLSVHSDSVERFDLAAFDDLLMLYNVAQTTPASSRGHLPGRIRTAPSEVPLPEVVFDTPSAPAPLSLHEAHLDLLSAAPAEAPLAPPTPLSDSPFNSTTHFAPDEMLIDGLSLDWGTSSTAAPSSAATPSEPDNTGLDAYLMDERDLPPPPKPQ